MKEFFNKYDEVLFPLMLGAGGGLVLSLFHLGYGIFVFLCGVAGFLWNLVLLAMNKDD